jgi:hypothetical protein
MDAIAYALLPAHHAWLAASSKRRWGQHGSQTGRNSVCKALQYSCTLVRVCRKGAGIQNDRVLHKSSCRPPAASLGVCLGARLPHEFSTLVQAKLVAH